MTNPMTDNKTTALTGLLVALAIVAAPTVASAAPTTYDGVTFPQGDISFADQVISYTLPGGANDPDPTFQNPADALGPPNFTPPAPTYNTGEFVSIGNGGQLIVKFTDNLLTGSGDAGLDLWIFEVGAVVEGMTVDVSADGVVWTNVGTLGGATAGVDIDFYGFNTSSVLRYVRLTDDGDGTALGMWAGADIDAVGAISTIPEPGTLALLGLGAAAVLLRHRRRRTA